MVVRDRRQENVPQHWFRHVELADAGDPSANRDLSGTCRQGRTGQVMLPEPGEMRSVECRSSECAWEDLLLLLVAYPSLRSCNSCVHIGIDEDSLSLITPTSQPARLAAPAYRPLLITLRHAISSFRILQAEADQSSSQGYSRLSYAFGRRSRPLIDLGPRPF